MITDFKIKFEKIDPRAEAPEYAHKGDSGFDLKSLETIMVPAGETRLIPTGLAFEIPIHYELQIRPRSGNSLKTGIMIANSPGTVDSNYRGEVGIIIRNLSKNPFTIQQGMKVAQGVVCPVVRVRFEEADELDDTERNDNGFGSTGV